METLEVQIKSTPAIEMMSAWSAEQAKVKDGERKDEKVPKPKEDINTKFNQKEKERMAFEIADSMNKVAKALNTRLTFQVDESTGRLIVKVIDSETGEVRRQIPPEEMVRLVEKMKSMVGMLFNQEA